MDEGLKIRVKNTEKAVNKLKEFTESRLAEDVDSVDLILLRDNCIDYIEDLNRVKERMNED